MHRRVTVALALVALSLAAPVWAAERVSLEEAPEKVRATIERHVGDGSLVEVRRQQEKEMPDVYEAEYWTDTGRRYKLKVGPDGTLLSKEEED